MNRMIQLDLRFAREAFRESELELLEPAVAAADAALRRRQVAGADFLGWLDLASRTLAAGTQALEEAAEAIRSEADVLVVVGIGGSYLGARAAFEFLKPQYYNQLPRSLRGGPELYFAGNHLSARGFRDLLRTLEGKRVYLNVISKSGTTTEPALAFRVLRAWLEQTAGHEAARKQIYVTTDAARGALKHLADVEGYPSFVVPDDVGGRYSVLTPVGLLPLAAIGVDIGQLLQGAAEAEQSLTDPRLAANAAYRYAAVRNVLYRKGLTTELFAYYEPALAYVAEWWKQLFGESEGKDGKGIFPASAGYTTDLHSLGQFVQEGRRNLFETVLRLTEPPCDLAIPSAPQMDDGLEYLAGRPFNWVNDQARLATQMAHASGGVPNLLVELPDMSERSLGQLFYFFELACAMSGQLMGVNAFDQPGVEAYKTNMFALLGKPGYELQQAALRAQLESAVT
ncbi:MAG: glucose-6-phosphate isomerase [Alicyclobacillus sp.]|nr:glucose-6-phosphate isomerase [Alicyclobacillus sp.]